MMNSFFSIFGQIFTSLSIQTCDQTWPSDSFKNIYYGFDAVENCILPAFIIIYCYVVILIVLKNRRIPGEGIGNERVITRIDENRIKIMKTIFVITMYFILSGVPLYVTFLVYESNRNDEREDHGKILILLSPQCKVLRVRICLLQLLIIPFIFGWIGNKFSIFRWFFILRTLKFCPFQVGAHPFIHESDLVLFHEHEHSKRF